MKKAAKDNPSGAKFLAKGSKELPKSYFDNMKKPEKKNMQPYSTPEAKRPQDMKNHRADVQPVGSVRMNSSDILNSNINQGFMKTRDIKTKGGRYRMGR